MKYKQIVLILFLFAVFFLSSHPVSARAMCIMRACPDVDCPNGMQIDALGCQTCGCNGIPVCQPAQTPIGLSIADYSNGIIQWDAATNAATYDVRINDVGNGWVGDCTKTQESGDVCVNGVRGTTFNYLSTVGHTFQAGHTYSIWVHSMNGCSYSVPAGLNISISNITPTPYIQINVKNPQGGAVVVPFLGFSYGGCGGYNQCFSVVGYNNSSYTIYAYQRSPGGGGIALGTNQMYLGVTPSVGGGSTNITNNNVCRSGYCTPENNTNWYNYWWPTFPSTGSRSLTFIVATPTPIPPQGCGAGCPSGKVCYQPPMPPCGTGACIQVMPPMVCVTPTPLPCEDSDGGKNSMVKGFVKNQYETVYDNCMSLQTTSTTSQWVAKDPGTHVQEGYCPKTGTEDIGHEAMACANGCTNGACIGTPVDPCPSRGKGDTNCSTVVDAADFVAFKSAFNGQSLPAPQSADHNKDNVINLVDFEIWRNTFHK